MQTIVFLINHLAVVDPFPKIGADSDQIKTLLNVVFAITGALSLLFVTIGGFRFVISRGDPNSINQARNTIIYAVVGLGVTVSAFAIVNFVFGKL